MSANGNEAINALATLEKQRAALAAELARVEGQRVNAVKDLDAATQRAARILALQAALAQTDADLPAVRAAAAAAQVELATAARSQQYAAAADEYEAAVRAVVAALPGVQAVVDRALAAGGAAAALGYIDRGVVAAVGALGAGVRTCHAELAHSTAGRAALGLPAFPTADAVLEAECRANVTRLEGLVAQARERMERAEPGSDHRHAAQDTLKEYIAALAREKARLTQMTGGLVGNLERLIENLQMSMSDGTAYDGKSPAEVERLRQEREARAGRKLVTVG